MTGEKSRATKRWLWFAWGVLTVIGIGYLTAGVLSANAPRNPVLASARSFLLPGKTTHGHYQIELACESCHTAPFGGIESLQEACEGCHGAELKEANDKHPKSKFTDPRNAELIERIDATLCVSCHAEHKPSVTHAMGLSVPVDVCAHCHQDIAEDRPSHAGMGFDTCASAGCHNYHDNRALYEDFLLKHADEPSLAAKPVLRTRDFIEVAAMLPDYPSSKYPIKPLTLADADAPKEFTVAPHSDDWLASRHAQAGVNCSACHTKKDDELAAWIAKPNRQACASCHALEVKGFELGKHGMRLAADLNAMTPGQARLPMNGDAHDRALGCSSCHAAHAFDTRTAAVEGCLGCHADRHSLAYKTSPHYELWQQELSGEAESGTGVTCASCHLPRVRHTDNLYDISRTLVQHNQNDTLRPNEKQLRPVCLECHGLAFAIDALADANLIERNFQGQPSAHIASIDMAAKREIDARAE